MTMTAAPVTSPQAIEPPAVQERVVGWSGATMAQALSLLYDVSVQESDLIVQVALELQGQFREILFRRVEGCKGDPTLLRIERRAQATFMALWMRAFMMDPGARDIGTRVPWEVGKTLVALEMAEAAWASRRAPAAAPAPAVAAPMVEPHPNEVLPGNITIAPAVEGVFADQPPLPSTFVPDLIETGT